MASDNLLVAAITQVDTAALYPLGTLFEEPAGYGSDRDPATSGSKSDRGRRVWIYVFNDSGSSVARGTVCSRKTGVNTYNIKACPTSGVTSSGVVGVGDHTIATASYGWIIREGMCEVTADDGDIAADATLVPGNTTAGRADTNTTLTAGGFGVATEAATVGNLATCYVSCRG